MSNQSSNQSSNQAIAQAYFDAVRSKDAQAIKQLFHQNSELHTVAGVYTGPDAIAEFYQNTAFNFQHVNPNVGPMIESQIESKTESKTESENENKSTVACEIILELDDSKNKVADFFTISNGKIDKLVVYLGPSE